MTNRTLNSQSFSKDNVNTTKYIKDSFRFRTTNHKKKNRIRSKNNVIHLALIKCFVLLVH